MDAVIAIAISTTLSALVGAVVSGLIVRVKTTAKQASEESRALRAGMRVLMRKEVVDAYDKYVHLNHKLTVERRSEVDQAYKVYSALGGNGTITALYEEIKALDTFIVR